MERALQLEPPRPGGVRVVPLTDGPSHQRAATPADPTVYALHLAPVPYAITWLGFSLLHIVCIVYLVVSGVVFWSLPTLDDMFYLDFYTVALHSRHGHTIAVVHYILASIHVFLLSRPLLLRLAGCLKSSPTRTPNRKRPRFRLLRRITRRATKVYWLLFSRTGLFGVQGRYYEVFFTTNEVLDIVLQTNQGFQLSRQSSHRSLNRFFIATLVLNCTSTPLIHALVAHKPTQRLFCRLADLILDFLVSAVVPVVLAHRIYVEYDPVMRAVPPDLWYTDTWLVQTLKEAPIVLFGSWTDALSRLAFCVGLITSLNSVKNLLRRAVNRSPLGMDRKFTHSAPARPDFTSPKVLRAIHVVMVTFGIVVLGVHLHAESRPSPASCALEVRPWLATKPACALVEFNCFQNHTLTGNASDFDAVFGSLYTPSLLHIVYRHCPHVQLGLKLTEFHELVGFKTYNSTIVTWEDEAALTQTQHRHMTFAFFVETNFSNGELPLGLRSRDFPEELLDIEISVSNLRDIPGDLHERWHSGATIVIEFSRLTTVPLSLFLLNPDTLTLDANDIHELSVEALVLGESRDTSFSGNPIASLPEAPDFPAPTHKQLGFASTQLTTLPAWMTTPEFLATTKIVAKDTPLCQRILDGNETLPAWTKSIRCGANSTSIGYYPRYVEVRTSETDWQ